MPRACNYNLYQHCGFKNSKVCSTEEQLNENYNQVSQTFTIVRQGRNLLLMIVAETTDNSVDHVQFLIKDATTGYPTDKITIQNNISPAKNGKHMRIVCSNGVTKFIFPSTKVYKSEQSKGFHLAGRFLFCLKFCRVDGTIIHELDCDDIWELWCSKKKLPEDAIKDRHLIPQRPQEDSVRVFPSLLDQYINAKVQESIAKILQDAKLSILTPEPETQPQTNPASSKFENLQFDSFEPLQKRMKTSLDIPFSHDKLVYFEDAKLDAEYVKELPPQLQTEEIFRRMFGTSPDID